MKLRHKKRKAQKSKKMEPPYKKCCKMQKEEDRISKLPDEILVSILCFLSTGEAAKTSVLSRRWEKLWLNTPSLDFYSKKIMKNLPVWPGDPIQVKNSERYDYIKRVNQFIKLHQLPILDEFTIGFPLDAKHSDDIDRWVEFAAKKQVKKLKLEFGIRKCSPADEPPIYDIKFLANFRMYWLRDLFLGRVNVCENMLESLISNSPLLERLSVMASILFEKLEVVTTNLKYLNLGGCLNLQHLKISAPNLNTMDLLLYCWLDHLSVSAPQLSRATLSIHSPFLSPYYRKLLAHFTQVKSLKLSTTTEGCFDIRFIPELRNIKHLEISIYPGYHVQFQWSCRILQAVPFLQSLSIQICKFPSTLKVEDIDFKWMHEDIPKKVKADVAHSQSHQYLKVVELIDFGGCRNEIEFVLQIFEVAVSLEKIIIRVYRGSDKYTKLFLECAELLKTHICSKLDVVII